MSSGWARSVETAGLGAVRLLSSSSRIEPRVSVGKLWIAAAIAYSRRAPDGREMRGFPEEGIAADAKLTGGGVKSGDLRFVQRRDAVAAIAIDPAHMASTLPRGLHEIAQEILFRFREIHAANFTGRPAQRQFRSRAALITGKLRASDSAGSSGDGKWGRPSALHRREHMVHYPRVLVLRTEQHHLRVCDDADAVPRRPVKEIVRLARIRFPIGVADH